MNLPLAGNYSRMREQDLAKSNFKGWDRELN